jgi:hypothetical protein
MLFVTLGIERMFEVAVSAVFVGLGVVLWALSYCQKWCPRGFHAAA